MNLISGFMQEEGKTVRVVILKESESGTEPESGKRSEAGREFRESIRNTYEGWLAKHVDDVWADKEANPLLSEIRARRGYDHDGKSIFVTTFHFKSEEALAEYTSKVAGRMRALIEEAYPGATNPGGFGYKINSGCKENEIGEFLKGNGINIKELDLIKVNSNNPSSNMVYSGASELIANASKAIGS